jgi:3-oxoadipate enol-lactonase
LTYAHVGELSVWYERRGEGPRVLFISGSGGDLRTKPTVFDGPLVRAFDLLAYDQRGLGQTSKPDGPYTMAEYGDDAAGLLDHVGWDRCMVVGISFGGMVAQELAIRHSDRVGRLVLCCTSSGGAGNPSYPLHELIGRPAEERRSIQLAISDTRFDQAWQAANPDDAARIFETMQARETDDDGSRHQLEARSHHDTYDRLDRITAPTLVCAGRYDGIAPVANSEAIVARIPTAELRVYEGGHLFLLQDRAAWDDIVGWLGVETPKT